jgi:ABC-type transport system involved in multi-copper enzyme maturation permease subunit
MTCFVKKEIRLLLPVWCSILALEIAVPWMFPWISEPFNLASIVFFLGLVILAVDSFGREFSLGTFQNLMAQPIERNEIWRTKIKLLVWGALLIFVAFFVSNFLRLEYAMVYAENPWRVTSGTMQSDFVMAMAASLVLFVIAISGGLWTTLLFRQIAAAFWITLLLPILGLLLLSFFLPEKLGENQILVNILFVVFAGLYGGWGFRLAHRLFMQAQDVAWTGGVIDFSRWRYFEPANRAVKSHRRWRPFAALLKKELQLQSVSFICAGALLAIHLVVLAMRAIHGSFQAGSTVEVITQNYWALWLIMPLLVGGTVVAEERKLNMTDVQFCLPVSRRKQFALKFIVTMALGVLFGGFVPVFLELGSAALGVSNNLFTTNDLNYQTMFDCLAGLVYASAGLSLLSIFASSLSRQFLQALTVTFVSGIGCGIFGVFLEVMAFNQNYNRQEALRLWSWPVAMMAAVPVLIIVLLWLAWRNFQLFHEYKRRLRMNIIGVTGALVFIVAASAAIYNRGWEYLGPAEPAHGAAKLLLSERPNLHLDDNSILSIRLPDGRVWLDCLEPKAASNWFSFPPMAGAGPRKFISGSNWVSVAVRYNEQYKDDQNAGYLDTVGIQSNGTLWVSEKDGNGSWMVDQLAQFGDESDWREVVRRDASCVLLLKTSGTLWRWGTNHFNRDSHPFARSWPGLRTFQPFQLGTNADWQALGKWGGSLARKSDGSVWEVSRLDANGVDGLRRMTNYDQVSPEVAASLFPRLAWNPYVRKDGTLWISYAVYSQNKGVTKESIEQQQISHETNWLSATWAGRWVVALRSDGTLWKWNVPGLGVQFSKTPRRLGSHSDWVALGGVGGYIVSLAADGSLWIWNGSAADVYPETWLQPSRRPELLCNIFDAKKL